MNILKSIFKTFVLTIIFLHFITSGGIIDAVKASDAINNGYDDLSPIVMVDKSNPSYPQYYYFASFINMANIRNYIPNNCNINSPSDRMQYKVTFGAHIVACDYSGGGNIKADIRDMLSHSKVTNMSQIFGSDVPDLTTSRFFIVGKEIRLTDLSKIKINNSTGDIYYDGSGYSHLMNIYDSDLEGTFFERNGLYDYTGANLTPNLTFSAFVLDSPRMTDNLIGSGIYTIEHFAGKKYTGNNGTSLRTTAFDGLPLYNMTYYDQPFLPKGDWVQYCNAYNFTPEDYYNLRESSTLKVFQDKPTGSTLEDRRTNMKVNCPGTSGLRVNNSFLPGITASGSISLQGNINGAGVINSVTKNYTGEPTQFLSFPAKGHDGEVSELRVLNKGIIGNLRDFENKDPLNVLIKLKGKTTTLYYLVKTNLLYMDYGNVTFSGACKNRVSGCEAANQFLVGFDPINTKWYNESDHHLVQNINSIIPGTTASAAFNKNSFIYKSVFSGNYSGIAATTGQGNMFVPFSSGNEMYSVSTPGFTANAETYTYDSTKQTKMRYRGVNVPLASGQGYAVSATHPDRAKDSGMDLGITSRALINGYGENKIRFLFNRNFDADAGVIPKDKDSGFNGDRDANAGYKLWSKSPFGGAQWVVLSDLLGPKDNDSYLYNIPGFKTDFSIVKNTPTNCISKYNIQGSSTIFSIRSDIESDANVDCSNTYRPTLRRLSGNAGTAGGSALNFTEGYQQATEGIVTDNSINKMSSKGLYVVSMFDNINDAEVNNQIFTNSNFLENLGKPKLECVLGIYKLPVKPNKRELYKSWKENNINLNSIAEYQANTNLFKSNDNPIFDIPLTRGLLDATANNMQFQGYVNSQYQNGSFENGYSIWNVGEKGVVGYYCKNLPKGKTYEVTVANDNRLYQRNDFINIGANKFYLFKTDNSMLAAGPKVAMNPENVIGYDYDGNQSTKILSEGLYSENKKTHNFYYNIVRGLSRYTLLDEGTTLGFVTDDIRNVNYAQGAIEINAIEDTEDKFSKINLVIKDVATKKIVFANEHYVKITGVKSPIELKNVIKQEQTVGPGYPHEDVTFEGNGGGGGNGSSTDFGLAVTLRNTTRDNVGCQNTNQQMYFYLDGLTQALKDSNSIASQVNPLCQSDGSYTCVTSGTDSGNSHQNTNVLFEKLVENNGITITERLPDGTTDSFTLLKSDTPRDNLFTYSLRNNTGGEKTIQIMFPSNRQHMVGLAEYEIKLSLPAGTFVGTNFWKDLPTFNKNAISIIPGVGCKLPDGSLEPKEVTISTLVEKTNLYQKLIVGSSDPGACDIPLSIDASNPMYSSNSNREVYLSQQAALANGKSCSDGDVLCLYEFEGVISEKNFGFDKNRQYIDVNDESDGTASPGNLYSFLVRNKINAFNSSGNTEATEMEIINNPMEVETIVKITGDITPEKGLVVIPNPGNPGYDIAASSMNQSSKNVALHNVYGNTLDYFYDYAGTSEWRTANLTSVYANGNNSFEWGKTNLLAFQTTDPSIILRSPSGNGSSASDKSFDLGIYGTLKSDKKPSAVVELKFGEENVPDELKNKTCPVIVNNFPEIGRCDYAAPEMGKMEVQAGEVIQYYSEGFNRFMDYGGNSYEFQKCGVGTGTDTEISLEYNHFKGKTERVGESGTVIEVPSGGVMFTTRVENPSPCGLANYTRENGNALDIFIEIENKSAFSECRVNTGRLGVEENDLSWSSNGVTIEGVELDAGERKYVEVACALNNSEPSCSEDTITGTATASNEYGEATTNDTKVSLCMNPTIQIKRPATVTDGNLANDKIESIYSTAYPFEVEQCSKVTQRWRFDYKGGCGLNDNELKDIKLRWYKGNSYDDAGLGRNFFDNVSVPEIAEINATNRGNYYEWNFNNANYNDIVGEDHSIQIGLDPDISQTGEIRGENSYFELQINHPEKITIDVQPESNVTCTDSGLCRSNNVSSAIGKNPIIENQRLYDKGIFTDLDNLNVYLHKEEIDGTSKIGGINGEPHYEPIHYEVTITNPSENTFYGLGGLEYSLDLGPTSPVFLEQDLSYPSKGNNITVIPDNIFWSDQVLGIGESKEYAVSVKLDPTLKSIDNPFVTPPIIGNPLSSATGYPLMNLDGQCDFKLSDDQFSINIEDNPIVIEEFYFEDLTENPGTDNQHLPGDIINFNFDITNTTLDRPWNEAYIDIDFRDITTDPNIALDMKELFNIEGNITGTVDPYHNIPMYEIPGEGLKCGLDTTKLICIFTDPLTPRYTTNIKIPLRVNVSSPFYENLKSSTSDDKYWYPIVIDKINYGTPELNSITHPDKGNITYYTSDPNNIPSGNNLGDMKVNDINDPNNTIIETSPDDGKYNFYLGIPYVEIENEIINNSIGHFSPGDVVTFKTTLKGKSKAFIRDILLNQELYKFNLNSDYVDTEVISVGYNSQKTNFNTTSQSVDFDGINSNSDNTDDVLVQNIENIKIQNRYIEPDPNNPNPPILKPYSVEGNNIIIYSDGEDYSYLEGTSDPNNSYGGTIEIITKVRIKGLKPNQLPQIGCSAISTEGCDRETNENPKQEIQTGYADIAYIGSDRDAVEEDEYFVYFPILKSYLFRPTGDNYIPSPGTNMIKGFTNSATKVTYRIDNFIPTSYDNSVNGIGKARLPKAHIRLPVGVTYIPNTLKKVNNLSDTYPYGNEVSAGFEPTLTSASDYQVVETTRSTFEDNFLNEGSGWKLVDRTDTANFNLLKGTPFGFNYFNEAYNYFRISDDGVIALGYKTNEGTLEEGQYFTDKSTGTIKATDSVDIIFNKTLGGVLLPAGTRYINLMREYDVSDGIKESFIKAGTKVRINANDIVKFSKGMEDVEVSDYSKVSIFKTNVNTTNTAFAQYKLIAPIFHKLDMRDKDDKGHGVYEKSFYDPATGDLEGIGFQWYGYIEGTNKEVKFGVTLYSSGKYNNIKFTYGDFDPTLNIETVSGISNASEIKYSPYHTNLLQDLSNKNDILFDASSIYQELVFDVGYEPAPLDPVRGHMIDYQERETVSPYLFIDKPESRVAYTFEVNIQGDATACQSEYVESLGGSTLRWGRLTSLQTDFDDVDMFCFEAERPGMAILENGSYAKGGYKTAQSSCIVNHLSLMGFNASSIGWNDKRDNACWLTYNIKVKEKELSLNTSSPYKLLSEFSDVVDTRPVDFNQIIENKEVVFDTPSSIKIIDQDGIESITTKIPDFKSVGIKYATKTNMYLYGNSYEQQKSYVLFTSNNGTSWKILKTFEDKEIDDVFIYGGNIQVFFNDGTYKRNLDGGVGTWENGVLPNYEGINEIAYKTNSNGFIAGNNASLWVTYNSGRSYEHRKLSTEIPGIANNENINSIDIYGSNNIWLATNNGNILFSQDGGDTFVKKTTTVASNTVLEDYEDDSVLFDDNLRSTQENVATNDPDIDKDGSKSIKFTSVNKTEENDTILPAYDKVSLINISNTTSGITALKDVDGKKMPLGNFTLRLYISDKSETGDIEKLTVYTGPNQTGNSIEFNIKQYLSENSKELHNGYNDITFNINEENTNLHNINIIDNNYTTFVISSIKMELEKQPSTVNMDFVGLHSIKFNAIDQIDTIHYEYKDLESTSIPANLKPNTGSTDVILKRSMSNGPIDLSTFVQNGAPTGFLTFDLYLDSVHTKKPYSVKLGSSDDKYYEWSNIEKYAQSGELKKGWNTVKIPFSETLDEELYQLPENLIEGFSFKTSIDNGQVFKGLKKDTISFLGTSRGVDTKDPERVILGANRYALRANISQRSVYTIEDDGSLVTPKKGTISLKGKFTNIQPGSYYTLINKNNSFKVNVGSGNRIKVQLKSTEGRTYACNSINNLINGSNQETALNIRYNFENNNDIRVEIDLNGLTTNCNFTNSTEDSIVSNTNDIVVFGRHGGMDSIYSYLEHVGFYNNNNGDIQNTFAQNSIKKSNPNAIVWNNLKVFEIKQSSFSGNTASLAFDNLGYSAQATEDYRKIRFFTAKDGVIFTKNKIYSTNDNNIWTLNRNYGTVQAGMEFKDVIQIRGREVYSLIDTPNGWGTYYSLDKGQNYNMHLSASNLKLEHMDILDYDKGIAISENNTLYRLNMQTDNDDIE